MKVVIILLCLAAAANARPRSLRQQCAPTDPDCQQILPKRQSGPPEDEEYRKLIDSLVDDILRNMGNGAGGLRDTPTTKELAEQLVTWIVGKAFDLIGLGKRRQGNGQYVPPQCDDSLDCPIILPRRQSGPPDEAAVNKFLNSIVDEIMGHMETSAGSLRNAPPTKDLVEQLVGWFVGKAFEFLGFARLRQSNGKIPPPICYLVDPICRGIEQRRQSGPPDEAAVNNFKASLVDNILRHMDAGAGALRDTPPAKEIVLQLASWLYDQTSKFLGFGLRQA
uniref:Secreted protein n=1 Tax=Anopheles dirus TaxID=7168 RepID=A0A182NXE2_9DIPT